MTNNQSILPIVIPKWGFAMEEGKVIRWLKRVGEPIQADEDLVEIESEKVVNVLGSPGAGIVRRQLARPEDTRPVGRIIGVVAAPDVPEERIDAFVADFEARSITDSRKRPLGSTSNLREVSVDGRRITYIDAGSGDPVTIFVHGLGGDATSWAMNQPALAMRGRTIAIDLPGHGGSAKQVSSGTPDELAGVVVGLMDQLGIPRAHLVAHSLGTLVAMEFTHAQPSRVVSLSLLGGLGPGTRFDQEFIEAFITAERRNDLKPVLARLFANGDFVTRDLVQHVLQAGRIDGARDCLRRIVDASIHRRGSDQNPTVNLGRISVPVLVLWGRLDTIAPIDQITDLPPAVQVEVIEHAAHMVQSEAADRVNDLLIQHLWGDHG